MKYELETVRNRFWNPVREFHDLQKGINRLFDEFDWATPFQKKGTFESTFAPACDIDETEGLYLLSLDLPGVKKEDIKVDLVDRNLVISGERKDEKKEEKKSRHVVERYYGSFQRSISLPATVNADQIQASFDNGVLKISLPKAEAAKTKPIQVTDAKAATTTSSPSPKPQKDDAKSRESGASVRIA